ncbi:MAG TPA: AtpZ/AtpI family protein [Bryobacteraceae bacterium]|jgi:ATP synthase protein I|nr:AtpZ/AtpI family protein [Bryobacteraceae bacterium]
MAETPDQRLLREVGVKQERMLRARESKSSHWSAIAILGSVGWSIAVPTVVGAAAGVWVDNRWPSRFSWTVMLLFGGLLLGCVNAWIHITGDPK